MPNDSLLQLPKSVILEKGLGNLPCLSVSTNLAEARIYLHGAHVTHFQPRGSAPVLFLSKKSFFEAGKPIRGGVPVIFPWFGPRAGKPESPMHGFARLNDWSIASVEQKPDDSVVIVLTFQDDNSTQAMWNESFQLCYTISIGKELDLCLEVTNRGTQSFDYEEALHTYFSLGDARKVKVSGLEGSTYLDKFQDMRPTLQGPDPILFLSETNRIYLDSQGTCKLSDPVLQRMLINTKVGSNSTVVWNPWIETSLALPDFGDEEWTQMACVETCNIAKNRVKLEAGQKHIMRAKISSQPLPS